jgi:hypothetical protein
MIERVREVDPSLVDCSDSRMFGTVSLPSSEFKRLLGSVPPSAECAVGSNAPSAPEFLDSLLCVGTFSILPGVRWPSSAAADLLLASVLRSAPPVAPSTGTIRSRWWWLVSGATPLRYPSDVPSALFFVQAAGSAWIIVTRMNSRPTGFLRSTISVL